MENNKELLEATVKGLQEKIQSLQTDLNEKQKELEDINKPEMEAWMFDEIHGLVEDGIESFNFDSPDNYEFEFGMEYDGRVYVESVNIQSTYEITQKIMSKIDEHFKTKTKENTVTEVQKVI
tara:strand:+ start:139 stop:504 length:366 start_codon:yes stop_codon:yes gene_type:complete